jgi:cytochrome c oxidase subunit 3
MGIISQEVEALLLLLYVVTVVHLIHLAGGVISLLIIIYNHFKQKYNHQTLELNLVQCTGTFLTYYGFICFCFIFL